MAELGFEPRYCSSRLVHNTPLVDDSPNLRRDIDCFNGEGGDAELNFRHVGLKRIVEHPSGHSHELGSDPDQF